jgi:hypothetical protein
MRNFGAARGAAPFPMRGRKISLFNRKTVWYNNLNIVFFPALPEGGSGMDEKPNQEELEKLQIHMDEEERNGRYAPRPKWQIVMAWVLCGIVILGVLNLCYWQIFG